MFLLAHKAFCAKKILEASAVLQKISGLTNNQELFNYQIEMVCLNEELFKLSETNIQLEEDARVYKQEVVRLQEDIEVMRSNFEKMFRQNTAFQSNIVNISNIECASDDKADSILEMYTSTPMQVRIGSVRSPLKSSQFEHCSDDEMDYTKSRAEFFTIKKH